MACEFQKDVKFDEVEVGDLILVELFEGNHFYGDRRGIAKERVDDVWYFEDMYPVYKEAGGYRMFKVTDLSTPKTVTVETAELDRLRKIEDRIKARIEYRGKVRLGASMMKQKARDADKLEDYLKWDMNEQGYLTEIKVLEELLGE